MEEGKEEEGEEENEEEEEPAMPSCDQGLGESAGRRGGKQGFFRNTPCHCQSKLLLRVLLCPPRARGDVVKSRNRAVDYFTCVVK